MITIMSFYHINNNHTPVVLDRVAKSEDSFTYIAKISKSQGFRFNQWQKESNRESVFCFW